jgi:hypothetical protein
VKPAGIVGALLLVHDVYWEWLLRAAEQEFLQALEPSSKQFWAMCVDEDAERLGVSRALMPLLVRR